MYRDIVVLVIVVSVNVAVKVEMCADIYGEVMTWLYGGLPSP